LGAATLNAYPIEAIDRVEVVKGPLSGIYGADAVGGVIHLFTKKGGQGLGNVTASLGSDALKEIGIALNRSNEVYSLRFAAQTEETDGIDRTSIITDGNNDIDGFDEDAFSVAGRYKFNDTTQANLSILYSDSRVEFDNTFGADTGFLTDTKPLSTALNINTQINNRLRWNTTLGLNSDESDTPAFSSLVKTNRDSLGTDLAIQLNANNALTIGADYYQEDIEGSTDYPVSDRDNTGLFAQVQSSLGAFGFVVSLRHDDNSTYGSDTNISSALNYDFSENFRGVLSYGTAFSAPSFNLLYFPFFGNPDLLPEESESLEITFLGNFNDFNWRVSGYNNEIENLFSFDPNTFLAANIGEAELKGLELEVNTVIRDWTVGLNFDSLSATNQLTRIKLDDRAGKTLALSATRNFGDWDLGFNFKAEGDRFDNNGTKLSGFGLFDVSAQYQINQHFKVLASIDNVFDKDYTINLIGPTESYRTPGRQSKLTLKYNF